jgi:hypothetical protein
VDIRFVSAVVFLLVVIAAILGQLWLLERNRRVLAEDKLREMYLMEDLRLRTEAGRKPLEPLVRDQLPADQTVSWKARSHKAFRLSPSQGQALGLREGDVVVVGQGPSTESVGTKP